MPTLASILRRHRYDTYGFVSHVMLTPTYGMGEGFSHFDFSVLNVGDPHEVTTAKELTELAHTGMRNAKEPYFLSVHYSIRTSSTSTTTSSISATPTWTTAIPEIAFTDYYVDDLLKVVDHQNTSSSSPRITGKSRRTRKPVPLHAARGSDARAADHQGAGPGAAHRRAARGADGLRAHHSRAGPHRGARELRATTCWRRAMPASRGTSSATARRSGASAA